MGKIVRFGVSLPESLLHSFDSLIEKKGYNTRSEALRDLIRDSLVEEEWKSDIEIVGCITIVYDHHVRLLSEALITIQHNSPVKILSTLHLHLDHHNCLEVIVARGKGTEVRKLADSIEGQRGVKFAKLTNATTGKLLE